jgi:hypothetical protein
MNFNVSDFGGPRNRQSSKHAKGIREPMIDSPVPMVLHNLIEGIPHHRIVLTGDSALVWSSGSIDIAYEKP